MRTFTSRGAVTNRVLRSIVWVFITLAMWLFARWVLMPDRGLDLGDESLYLLDASAPQATAAFVFPFGWHTGPIFDAVGGDVASFRIAGAVLLAWVGTWVGSGAASVVQAARSRRDVILLWASGAAGAGASWMFYFTLLRAPGYNWVTLMGMGIAVGAALRQWADVLEGHPGKSIWRTRLLYAVLGFGVVFALAAKPTTPIFIGITYTLSALTVVGFRRALVSLGWVVLTSLIWIPVLVLVGWWPLEFVSVFWDAVHRPLVTENQTPLQASVNYLRIPFLAYIDFRGVPAIPVIASAFAFIALGTNIVWQWRKPRLLLLPFMLLLVLAGVFARSPLQLWQQGWERGNLTVALLLVVGAMLLIGLGNWSQPQKVGRIQLSVAVASLIALASAFGFSSTNTPYPMIKFAALLLIAAALLPLARVTDAFMRRTLAVILAIASVLGSLHLILLSQPSPYASSSLALQTEEVIVGRNGSALFVDSEKAAALSAIRKRVQDAGGSAIHLVAIGPDTPGMALASGATVPESVMLSWFGLPGDEALAKANLDRIDSTEWCESWLVTAPVQRGSELGQSERIAALFANHLGRPWPGDYDSEVLPGGFTLWTPEGSC